MKKITLLLFVLLPVLARAQTSLDNANTVEAVIGQCPDLPAAGALAAKERPAAIEIFQEKMEQIRKRLRAIIDEAEETSKENIMPVADKQVRELTGKSLGEVQNMSNAELEEMGHQKANSMLKKLGIKKSAKELEKGMSEAETRELSEEAMQRMSGMSMKELQALQNMSEEEQMAYMQQPGRQERTRKAAANLQPSASVSVKDMKSLMEVSEEIKKIQTQWSYIDNQYMEERKEMIEEMQRIIAKYEAQMPPESGKILDKWFGTVLLTYHTKEEQRLVERLRFTCYTECFTLWRNLITKRQGQLKIRLTDCHRADELAAKQRELQGMAVEIPASISFDVAISYLDITKEVVFLPWELYGADEQTPQPNS